MFETINFCLSLSAAFWDRPPKIKVFLDDDEKFSGEITADRSGPQKIVFSHRLRLHEPHVLRLDRFDKTLDQCFFTTDGQVRDQLLIINALSIDDTNVPHLISCVSQFVPVYPEPWKSQQIALGNTLEDTVLGENILGHNGSWYLTFTSPFWQFLFDDMDK